MRKLEVSEIKNQELEILKTFHAFCEKHHLAYSLAGGTLLGAIRHQGFIPWDDDIDVFMLRPDYEAFLDLRHEYEKRFHYAIACNRDNAVFPYTKIVDRSIQVKTRFNKSKSPEYLWIDVFPVDGLPDGEKTVEQIYRKCNFYRKIFLTCDSVWQEGSTRVKKIGKLLLRVPACIYGKQRCSTKLDKIAKRYTIDNSRYVGNVSWGLYGKGERMVKDKYINQVCVEFEGCLFYAMEGWNEYLSGIYGDYMQLPPKNKRYAHGLVAWTDEKSMEEHRK